MSKLSRIILPLLCLLSIALTCFCGCGEFEREYNDDIVYELQNGTDFIIIKEWKFLMVSGAEIYYKQGNEAPVLLGETAGADDGFCPFEKGLYEITQEEGSICVSWCFDPANDDRASWHSKSFDLP